MATATLPLLQISIEHMQSQYTQWSSLLQENPVAITEEGAVIGIMMSPEMYNQLRRIRAYLNIVALSHSLESCDVTAEEVYRMSREELETRN